MSEIKMNKILDLDAVIVVDYCKWQVKYGIMAVLLFVTFLCCLDESCHANELNKLPRNRTEIYNIQNVSIDYDRTRFRVQFDCNYIFPVSVESHFNMTKLYVQTQNQNYTILTNTSNKYKLSRHLSWDYLCSVKGNATVGFYRAKTLVYEKNFTNLS